MKHIKHFINLGLLPTERNDMQLPKVHCRTEYNYDRDVASLESGLKCEDPSKAIQSPRDETDINQIVRNFGLTGRLPDNLRLPQYGDFQGITDYHSAMNAVVAARESFDALPASIRSRFHNEPAEFIDWAADPKNRNEMKDLGLLSAEALEKDRRAEALAKGVDPDTGEVLDLKQKEPKKQETDKKAVT